jgi:hypothetical protein
VTVASQIYIFLKIASQKHILWSVVTSMKTHFGNGISNSCHEYDITYKDYCCEGGITNGDAYYANGTRKANIVKMVSQKQLETESTYLHYVI